MNITDIVSVCNLRSDILPWEIGTPTGNVTVQGFNATQTVTNEMIAQITSLRTDLSTYEIQLIGTQALEYGGAE